MTVSSPPLEREKRSLADQDRIVRLHGVTWAGYQRLLKDRGDHSAPRISYLEGEVEIMSPSRGHESKKFVIGRLVEVFCLEHEIEFSGFGSWTLKNKAAKRGAEPDECYVFGNVPKASRPDLAIEVTWTSGGIKKLDIYRKLRVREVWFWRRGRITVHALRGVRYEAITASEVLPGIDLEVLCRFLDRPTSSQAMRDYRAALLGR